MSGRLHHFTVEVHFTVDGRDHVDLHDKLRGSNPTRPMTLAEARDLAAVVVPSSPAAVDVLVTVTRHTFSRADGGLRHVGDYPVPVDPDGAGQGVLGVVVPLAAAKSVRVGAARAALAAAAGRRDGSDDGGAA